MYLTLNEQNTVKIIRELFFTLGLDTVPNKKTSIKQWTDVVSLLPKQYWYENNTSKDIYLRKVGWNSINQDTPTLSLATQQRGFTGFKLSILPQTTHWHQQPENKNTKLFTAKMLLTCLVREGEKNPEALLCLILINV